MDSLLQIGLALPAGTVTFLFTDIVGSTPLWERQPDRMAEADFAYSLSDFIRLAPFQQSPNLSA